MARTHVHIYTSADSTPDRPASPSESGSRSRLLSEKRAGARQKKGAKGSGERPLEAAGWLGAFISDFKAPLTPELDFERQCDMQRAPRRQRGRRAAAAKERHSALSLLSLFLRVCVCTEKKEEKRIVCVLVIQRGQPPPPRQPSQRCERPKMRGLALLRTPRYYTACLCMLFLCTHTRVSVAWLVRLSSPESLSLSPCQPPPPHLFYIVNGFWPSPLFSTVQTSGEGEHLLSTVCFFFLQ